MSATSTKPQCPAKVDGTNPEGRRETFFCLLREGHRGAHRFHDTLVATLDQPVEPVG